MNMPENRNEQVSDYTEQLVNGNASVGGNGDPQGPIPPNVPQQHPNDAAAELKTIRNLLMAGNILGPVSIIIGGVFASAAGLICGLVARHKTKRLEESRTQTQENMAILKRSCNITLAICSVTLVLNAISLVMTMFMVMQMIESGEFANLVAQNMGNAANPATGSSTWG